MSHKDPGNTVENGVNVNNQEVLRTPDGRFVKGTISANPSGRPKDTGFKQRLNELVGGDSREIALKLAEIACYDQKNSKDRVPKYKTCDILRATELILKYKELVPVVRSETTIVTPENTKWKLEITHVDKEDENEAS